MQAFPDICNGGAVSYGKFEPAEVIEGSVVTLKCDKEYRSEGQWHLTCKNGTWGDKSNTGFPKCIPLKKGDLV